MSDKFKNQKNYYKKNAELLKEKRRERYKNKINLVLDKSINNINKEVLDDREFIILKHNKLFRPVLRQLIKRRQFHFWVDKWDEVMAEFNDKKVAYFIHKNKQIKKRLFIRKGGEKQYLN